MPYPQGAINTPIHGVTGQERVESAKKQLASYIPRGHLGEPADIAQAVLYLASDASRYMLGAELVADGEFAQLQGIQLEAARRNDPPDPRQLPNSQAVQVHIRHWRDFGYLR
jgi:hypothetical protein